MINKVNNMGECCVRGDCGEGCCICEELDNVRVFGIEGNVLWVCAHCVEAALAVHARVHGVIS
jgi:hypothetical protein